jgi:hypothetical protein
MSNPDEDTVENFEHFWKGLVCDKRGRLLKKQVMRELHDYSLLMDAASKVYDEVTGGKVSKPNTRASAVIALANDFNNEVWEETLADEKDEWQAEHDLAFNQEILSRNVAGEAILLAALALQKEIHEAKEMLGCDICDDLTIVEGIKRYQEMVRSCRKRDNAIVAERDAEVERLREICVRLGQRLWNSIP